MEEVVNKWNTRVKDVSFPGILAITRIMVSGVCTSSKLGTSGPALPGENVLYGKSQARGKMWNVDKGIDRRRQANDAEDKD